MSKPIDKNSFKVNGKKIKGASSSDSNDVRSGKRWFQCKTEDLPDAVFATVKALQEQDGARRQQIQKSIQLYGNYNAIALNGPSIVAMPSASPYNLGADPLTCNICQMATDTVAAKMAKNKPTPWFLTEKGDRAKQKKAEKLTQFVEGVFYQNDAHAMGRDMFFDAAITGDGLIHAYNYHGRIQYERMLSIELLTDWLDGFYGKPTMRHRIKRMDKYFLMDMFPEKAALIRGASDDADEAAGAFSTQSDGINVVESWRLPSGPGKKDGRHSICIADGALLDEKWEHPKFPFARFRYSKRPVGDWGQGLIEQIQSDQKELNKLLWIMQRSFHLAGTFKILMEMSSKIVKEHLDNEIGAIIMYQGTEPKYIVPPIVPAEYFQQIKEIYSRAFEKAGVSAMSVAALKPAGLNSGKALDTYNDIESERFMLVGQGYEEAFMQLSDLTIMVGKEIYEEDKKFSVQVPGRKFIETIPWKDVDMEADEYILKAFPISAFSKTPSGRLKEIQEYQAAGYINIRQGRKLMDFPDLDKVQGLQDALENYFEELFEKMLDKGEDAYEPPDPYFGPDGLNLGKEMAQEYYAQALQSGVDEDHIQLLRDYIDACNEKMKEAMQYQAQMGAQAGAAVNPNAATPTLNAQPAPAPGAPNQE